MYFVLKLQVIDGDCVENDLLFIIHSFICLSEIGLLVGMLIAIVDFASSFHTSSHK